MTDEYLTIASDAEYLFTEKRSKFLAFAHPVESVDEIKTIIAEMQKKYYDARHVCYAYMLGPERKEWRINDNGEPSGTAGKPILGQINSNNLTDILIVVVRYFGGVKLGTSGLIEAYKESAAGVIEAAEKITKHVQCDLTVLYNYVMMNDLMKVVKDLNVNVTSMDYGLFESQDESQDESSQEKRTYECKMVCRSRLSDIESISSRIDKIIDILGNRNVCYFTDIDQ